MKISSKTESGITVATLAGRLDSTTTGIVQKELLPIATLPKTRLILDMSDLEYMSSAGLRSVLDVAKKVRAGAGKLAIAAMKEPIREIYEISGFHSVIPSFSDVASAQASLAN